MSRKPIGRLIHGIFKDVHCFEQCIQAREAAGPRRDSESEWLSEGQKQPRRFQQVLATPPAGVQPLANCRCQQQWQRHDNLGFRACCRTGPPWPQHHCQWGRRAPPHVPRRVTHSKREVLGLRPPPPPHHASKCDAACRVGGMVASNRRGDAPPRCYYKLTRRLNPRVLRTGVRRPAYPHVGPVIDS